MALLSPSLSTRAGDSELLVAVGDATPSQVVRADLDLNLVTGQYPDAAIRN